MGLEVYFDQTGNSNKVKLDADNNTVKLNDNTVKIDPNANTVKVTAGPAQYWMTRNAAGTVPNPIKADALVVGTSMLDPGWYEIVWVIGLTGRAAATYGDAITNMSANMKLKVGNVSFRGVYPNSEKTLGVLVQPKVIVQVTGGNTNAQVVAIADDNNRDQFYTASINATRIA